ncbi:MPN domain-containing protein [Elysia marginata]|uniref:MPN domain-containing protein n=1 Tax=Elysia marginata TaxID=1093978 RepID=A0AAV4IJU0_9GAST|nr:MPN domain-containing protein [Elysia marginata]
MESALPEQDKHVAAKDIEEDEEENDEEEEDSEASSSNEDEESMKKAVQALTCRKVTLMMLMEDGLIEAGESVLTIDYLGQRFEADLLPSGKIKWHGSEEEFGTPSAWALHCKRLVNPVKRSGCGWASVRYKNKKLDIWKSIWARKQRLSSSSKSPQISPGLRLSSSSSQPDIAGHGPGLASPTGLRGAAGSGRLVSPPSNISTPVSNTTGSLPASIASTTTTNIAASASSNSATSQLPSLAVSVVSNGAESAPTPTSPQLSSSFTPAVVANTNNEAVETGSDPHKATQDVPSDDVQTDPGSKDQTTAGQDSEKMAKTDNLKTDRAKTGDAQIMSALTSGTVAASDNQPSSQTSPCASFAAGETHSPNKKAKKEDGFSPRLSRELPSPTPGPLPPKAILQQPVRLGEAELGLQRGGREEAWEVYHQQHQQPQPEPKRRKSDFHCHLTKSEVVGYLGGRWDCQRQHLSIEQAFPAKCRLGDKDRSTIVEEEIRRSMRQKGMMVVGWYHSHPACPPDPSLRDLDCQMAYQLRMRGSGAIYLPCVGFILSPFEKFPPKQDSKIQAYWVMPNLEHPTSFNIPMHVTHSIVRDVSLTEDLLADLKALCEFYSGAVDKIRLRENWGEAITYLDKVKASLRSKLPQDQLDSSTFLDYVQQLLGDMK